MAQSPGDEPAPIQLQLGGIQSVEELAKAEGVSVAGLLEYSEAELLELATERQLGVTARRKVLKEAAELKKADKEVEAAGGATSATDLANESEPDVEVSDEMMLRFRTRVGSAAPQSEPEAEGVASEAAAEPTAESSTAAIRRIVRLDAGRYVREGDTVQLCSLTGASHLNGCRTCGPRCQKPEQHGVRQQAADWLQTHRLPGV